MRALGLHNVRDRVELAYGQTRVIQTDEDYRLRFRLYGVDSIENVETTLLALMGEEDGFEVEWHDGDGGVVTVDLREMG